MPLATFNCKYLLILCLLFAFISIDSFGSYELEDVMDENNSVTSLCIYGYSDDADESDHPENLKELTPTLDGQESLKLDLYEIQDEWSTLDMLFFDFYDVMTYYQSEDLTELTPTLDGQESLNLDLDEIQNEWSTLDILFFDFYDVMTYYLYHFFELVSSFLMYDVTPGYHDRVCVPLSHGDEFNYLLPENGFCQRDDTNTRVRVDPQLTPFTFSSDGDKFDLLWMDVTKLAGILEIMDDYYLMPILRILVVVLIFRRKKMISFNSKGFFIHYAK
ncbi:uncharacterized protein [Apostichopus japonicus]|uniref:uncharacterized protein n=1 Tax=Stichopus japonicus TaxID=307972 RepID=UPI003AB274EE